MSESEDPPRLRDLDGASAALLRDAADVPVMSKADRAAILAGVGMATATATATATTGTGASVAKATGALGSKGLLVGIVSFLVAGGVAATLALSGPTATATATSTSTASAPLPAAGPTPSSAAALPSATPTELSPLPAAALPSAAPTELSPLPAAEAPSAAPVERGASPAARPGERPAAAAHGAASTSARAAAPAASTASASAGESGANASAESESSLAAESALIGKARGLVQTNPQAALALLEEHRREHPRGELAAEREFLTIKALRRAGRIDEARERARSYPARFPSSPYTPSVQGILSELGGP